VRTSNAKRKFGATLTNDATPTRNNSNTTSLNTPPTPITPSNTENLPTKLRKVWRNNFETAPKTPDYTPYQGSRGSGRRQNPRAFYALAGEDDEAIQPLESFSTQKWQNLCETAKFLPEGESPRDFQMQAANCIIGMTSDLCVIAPTGSGKSLLWHLPLLAHRDGISLVITPYTSLGIESESRYAVTASKRYV
jgi:ATP-dependent helicase YprA (DUF1998 family)